MDLKIASHILLLNTWGHSELNCSLFGLGDFIHSHRFYYENVMRVFEYNKRVWISTAIVKTRPYSRYAGTGFVEIFPRVRSTDVLPARTPNSIFLATYVFIIKFVTRLAPRFLFNAALCTVDFGWLSHTEPFDFEVSKHDSWACIKYK